MKINYVAFCISALIHLYAISKYTKIKTPTDWAFFGVTWIFVILMMITGAVLSEIGRIAVRQNEEKIEKWFDNFIKKYL